MAFSFFTKNNKKVTLLTPHERGGKFAKELSAGYKFTNDGLAKLGKDKSYSILTDEERAFRSGYLTAQKDNARVFKAKNKKK